MMHRAGLLTARRLPLLRNTLKPLRSYSTRTWKPTDGLNKRALALGTLVTIGAIYGTTGSMITLEGKDRKKESDKKDVKEEKSVQQVESNENKTQPDLKNQVQDSEKAQSAKDQERKESVEKSDSKTPKANEAEHEGEEEPKRESAYDPETGEINWDCPCLGGMAHGPCGEEFKAAFSCFVYSEAEPKGIDCVEKFRGMQECFRRYPEHYAEQIKDEEEAAQAAAEMESTNNQEKAVPEAQMTTPETSADVKQEEATFEPILEEHHSEHSESNSDSEKDK